MKVSLGWFDGDASADEKESRYEWINGANIYGAIVPRGRTLDLGPVMEDGVNLEDSVIYGTIHYTISCDPYVECHASKGRKELNYSLLVGIERSCRIGPSAKIEIRKESILQGQCDRILAEIPLSRYVELYESDMGGLAQAIADQMEEYERVESMDGEWIYVGWSSMPITQAYSPKDYLADFIAGKKYVVTSEDELAELRQESEADRLSYEEAIAGGYA